MNNLNKIGNKEKIKNINVGDIISFDNIKKIFGIDSKTKFLDFISEINKKTDINIGKYIIQDNFFVNNFQEFYNECLNKNINSESIGDKKFTITIKYNNDLYSGDFDINGNFKLTYNGYKQNLKIENINKIYDNRNAKIIELILKTKELTKLEKILINSLDIKRDNDSFIISGRKYFLSKNNEKIFIYNNENKLLKII